MRSGEELSIGQSDLRPYPKYKPGGSEWLGQVPQHWNVARLRRTIMGCLNGIWGDEPDGENDMPCVRVADFDRTALKVRMEGLTMRSIKPAAARGRTLERGDLLLEKSGGGEKQPVGAVMLYDHNVRAVCSNFVARVTVASGFDSKFLCYLHYWLYSSHVNIRSVKQSTGIQNLDSYSYLNEVVATPEFPEQRKIAAFLDRETGKIDALVAKKEELIKLLQEKRTALITHVVTKGLDPDARMKDSGIEWLGDIPAHWRISRLKFEASHVVDCLHSTPQYIENGEHAAIRTADVSPGRLHISGARRVGREEYRERTKRLVPVENDILYSREGERFGIAALVPAGVRLCLAQRMMHFRAGVDVDPAFVMWTLNSDGTRSQAALDVAGSTSPHINVETIRNFELPVPPGEEQEKIVEHITTEAEAYDVLEEAIVAGIVRLQELRTALISAAVTGKIDVRAASAGASAGQGGTA